MYKLDHAKPDLQLMFGVVQYSCDASAFILLACVRKQ